MNRWKQQLEDHPIWSTVTIIEEHLSVEFDDADNEQLSEKRRLKQFADKLFKVLNALDAEQTPFNRLNELDDQLNRNIVNQTRHYSTTGEIKYLRNANDQLQNSLFEICILQWCTLLTKEEGKVAQINELADKFVSLMSDWKNQFSDAQEVNQNEYNVAHQQRDETFKKFLKMNEQTAKSAVDKLVLERDAQLEAVLDDAKTALGKSKKVENEISQLHQLAALKSTTIAHANIAYEERKQAGRWRLIGVTFIIIAAVWLVIAAMTTFTIESPTKSVYLYFSVASVGGVLLFGAGYGTQQSNRHRNNEIRNRNIALKLATFEPFISSLTDNDKIELRKQFSKQLFISDEFVWDLDERPFMIIDRFFDIYKKFRKAHKQ